MQQSHEIQEEAHCRLLGKESALQRESWKTALGLLLDSKVCAGTRRQPKDKAAIAKDRSGQERLPEGSEFWVRPSLIFPDI